MKRRTTGRGVHHSTLEMFSFPCTTCHFNYADFPQPLYVNKCHKKTENQPFRMSQRCTDTSWVPPLLLVRVHTPGRFQPVFALFYPLANKQKAKLWFSFNWKALLQRAQAASQKKFKSNDVKTGLTWDLWCATKAGRFIQGSEGR